MPIDLDVLSRQVDPGATVLLLGAGSSIPSGGLSGRQLAEAITKHFKLENVDDFTLPEISALVEKKFSRRSLIDYLRSEITRLRPTGAVLNLPLYDWRGIYTTNYDTIIEQSFDRAKGEYLIYSSNFDFTVHQSNAVTKIFKLHGTIDKDPCYGDNSRIIITEGDYDITASYRETLYENFSVQINSGNLVIIGNSLNDPDLKEQINEALRRKRDSGGQSRIFLLIYTPGANRAELYEDRGVQVCFAGLDSFFSALAKRMPDRRLILSVTADPLDRHPSLRAATLDASHAIQNVIGANVVRMFNGRAASYGDIQQSSTFERDIAGTIETALASGDKFIATIIGAAGVGKTTLGRQVVARLCDRGFFCWEHRDEFALLAKEWLAVAEALRTASKRGVLFIDDAHDHLREVGDLVDGLARHPDSHLKIILGSTRHRWNPRVKSPTIFARGTLYELTQLTSGEIESMLDLLERNKSVAELVEERFNGFSRPERRRRLIDRCSADMFVCLKNIFSFDSIDDIILRDYNDLDDEGLQSIYRTVAAMEASGVKVHRQLVIRTLGVSAEAVGAILGQLTDIITEYTVSEKEGIYMWRGRHSVVVNILTSYKYNDQDAYFSLIENVISNLNLTLNVEVRTLRDLCDMQVGVGRIHDKARQNILFRRMISIAPNERVPRHRLIRNLIDQDDYEQAETEIRIFEKELRTDAPVVRYKVLIALRRAETVKGLMPEDRGTIILRGASIAEEGLKRYTEDKNLYAVYCDAGIAYYKHVGRWELFDKAMASLRDAENRILDPEVGRLISRYEVIAQRLHVGAD